jgi:hypothetical protein
MWINEIVFAIVVCYSYGLAAPMWYGTSLCFQIAVMGVLGFLAKLRVPFAHMSLEVIRQRYGNIGHIVFVIFGLINNTLGARQ